MSKTVSTRAGPIHAKPLQLQPPVTVRTLKAEGVEVEEQEKARDLYQLHQPRVLIIRPDPRYWELDLEAQPTQIP